MTSPTPKPGTHISNNLKKDSSDMQPKKYVRKPFEVNAVQVTEENFEEVAVWCGGTIVTTRSPQDDKAAGERYIKVEVSRPLNERQTKAYVGDWLLEAARGFKVYTDGPFARNFALVPTGDDIPQELFVTATNE